MTIICIEGASAVGKSTVCSILEADFGFTRIPEVNELFSRGPDESPSWYFERQMERWNRACEVSSTGGSAVLDGDPFQPLWYNWIFPVSGLQPVSEVIRFYREKVLAGIMRFPDKYYLLTCSELELRRRKAADRRRSRRNFEKHLGLIKPQLAYFSAMNDSAPGLASVVESIAPQASAKFIARDALVLPGAKDHSCVFDRMCRYVGDEYDNHT